MKALHIKRGTVVVSVTNKLVELNSAVGGLSGTISFWVLQTGIREVERDRFFVWTLMPAGASSFGKEQVESLTFAHNPTWSAMILSYHGRQGLNGEDNLFPIGCDELC